MQEQKKHLFGPHQNLVCFHFPYFFKFNTVSMAVLYIGHVQLQFHVLTTLVYQQNAEDGKY